MRRAVLPARQLIGAGDAHAFARNLLLEDRQSVAARRIGYENLPSSLDRLLRAVGLEQASTPQPQPGVGSHGQKWNPIVRHVRRKAIRQRLRRLLTRRCHDVALFLEAIDGTLALALDDALDAPGHVRHLVAQEQHFFYWTTLDRLHQCRREQEQARVRRSVST